MPSCPSTILGTFKWPDLYDQLFNWLPVKSAQNCRLNRHVAFFLTNIWLKPIPKICCQGFEIFWAVHGYSFFCLSMICMVAALWVARLDIGTFLEGTTIFSINFSENLSENELFAYNFLIFCNLTVEIRNTVQLLWKLIPGSPIITSKSIWCIQQFLISTFFLFKFNLKRNRVLPRNILLIV